MAIEDRVQLIKETGWRQAAPDFVPQRFMPAGIVVSVNARENALFVGRSNNPNRLTRFVVTDSTVALPVFSIIYPV